MTSITYLRKELYENILEMDVVDIHQHLDPVSLAAKSFEDVIFYHHIVTELMSAGMDKKEFEKSIHRDRLLKVLPYFKYIRNTATFWCLKQILRDLYGVDVKSIDERNWRDIVEAIEGKPRDNAWAYNVLRKFCKVRKSFLTLSPLAPIPQYDKDVFTGALRVEPLIQHLSKDVVLKLEQVYGIGIDDVEDLDKVFEEMFKRYSNDIVAITIPIQPNDVFKIVHKSEASLYIKELKYRGVLDTGARITLASYTLHKLISLCEEHEKVVQLMLGVKRPIPMASPPDYAITIYDPTQVLNIVNIFAMYPEVKFDIMIADPNLSHQMAVIAKNYQNVYLSGYWWYSMYPNIIRSYLRVRLQMLPYNKVGGFFSDAYVVEWVYGRVLLVKKELAYVLAEMVYEEYIDKELALEIAKTLLSMNAINMYSL